MESWIRFTLAPDQSRPQSRSGNEIGPDLSFKDRVHAHWYKDQRKNK